MKCHTKRLFHNLIKYISSKSLLWHDDTPKSANYFLIMKRKAPPGQCKAYWAYFYGWILTNYIYWSRRSCKPKLSRLSSNSLTALLFCSLKYMSLMNCFLKFVFHQGYPERCTEMQGLTFIPGFLLHIWTDFCSVCFWKNSRWFSKRKFQDRTLRQSSQSNTEILHELTLKYPIRSQTNGSHLAIARDTVKHIQMNIIHISPAISPIFWQLVGIGGITFLLKGRDLLAYRFIDGWSCLIWSQEHVLCSIIFR